MAFIPLKILCMSSNLSEEQEMARITYESDLGNKLNIEIDESLIKHCDEMGIKVWQELLQTIRKEVEAEEAGIQ